MKIAVLISKKDIAGMNISKELEKVKIPFKFIENDSIYSENIDKELNIEEDFIIFATKHKSEKNLRTLTVHAPGNWKEAKYGGKPGVVCNTSALFLKHLFRILNEENEIKKQKGNSDYNVSLEATHHGPFLEKPCCFLEIGSSENEWNDKNAVKIIASTIERALKEKVSDYKSVIGIGGPHYCPNFNKIQLSSEYAVGHIIPEYSFINEKTIQEALGKTIENPKKAVIDWKGCGISKEREKIIKILESKGMEVLRTDRL